MSDYSDDDLVPLNSPRISVPNDLVPLNPINENTDDTDIIKFIQSTVRRVKVLESVLEKFLSAHELLRIRIRTEQLDKLDLETEIISRIICDDEVPPNPMTHMTAARKVSELKEAGFRYLLIKHGLEALVKKKEEEIEQMLLDGKSFEYILTMITERSLHPFLHQLK